MNRLAWLFAATLAGCIHGSAVEYSGPVRVDSAELIPINPDVKVVADAEEPMFFARGSYWMFHDAAWYSSASVRGTWTKINNPPVPVIQISQPYAYTHYRDDHPDERTVAVETDNTRVAQPNFEFNANPLTAQ